MISSVLLRADRALGRWPNTLLTLALLFVALVLIVLALAGRPGLKGAALAWVVLP